MAPLAQSDRELMHSSHLVSQLPRSETTCDDKNAESNMVILRIRSFYSLEEVHTMETRLSLQMQVSRNWGNACSGSITTTRSSRSESRRPYVEFGEDA